MLHLIEPTTELEESHETFLWEFQERDEQVHPWIVAEPYEDFCAYVEMLENASKGVGIPSDFVAHSTFWLLDMDGEIVAISNLRHELNDSLLEYGGHIGFGVRPSTRRQGYATEILRQTLMRAKKMNIGRVRVTCAKDNSASAKTILRNGGILEDECFMSDYGGIISRYWIDF